MNQMSQKSCLILGLALGVLLAIAPATLAEKPEDPGGKPTDEPGGSSDFAVLYGDLYVLERNGNGEPETRIVTYEDPEYDEPVDVDCLQPIAADCSMLNLWGEMSGFDAELYDPCEIHVDDLELAQEVTFGRQSVVRTDPTVIDSAYFEALKVLNSATEYVDPENASPGCRLTRPPRPGGTIRVLYSGARGCDRVRGARGLRLEDDRFAPGESGSVSHPDARRLLDGRHDHQGIQ